MTRSLHRVEQHGYRSFSSSDRNLAHGIVAALIVVDAGLSSVRNDGSLASAQGRLSLLLLAPDEIEELTAARTRSTNVQRSEWVAHLPIYEK